MRYSTVISSISLAAIIGFSLPAYAGNTAFEVDLFAVGADGEAINDTRTCNFCISETLSGSDPGTCLIDENKTCAFSGGVYETTVDLSSLAATPPDALCLWITIGEELLTPLCLGSVIWARWAEVAGSVASGGISASALATDAVTTTKILDGTIAAGDMATGAVTTTVILDGTIAAGDIATSAVTSAKILDGTIAAADLADSAVTTAKIVDATIAAGDLATGSVTSAKILDGTIAAADLDHTMTQTWTGVHTFSSTTIFDGATTFGTDADFNLAGSENVTIANVSATTDTVAINVTTTSEFDALGIGYTAGIDSASSFIGGGISIAATWTGSSATQEYDGIFISSVNNSTAGTQGGMHIKLADGTRNTNAFGIKIDNADTSGTTTDGLLIKATTGTITDGIQIGSGTETITNAINIASTGVTTDIILQNGETIDNNTDGTITLTGNVNVAGSLATSGSTSRFLGKKGADVTSANSMSLGADGNYFVITGATQIECIDSTSWSSGSVVFLKFTSNPAVNSSTGTCASPHKALRLAGDATFNTTSHDTLTLIYDGDAGVWFELSRSVN